MGTSRNNHLLPHILLKLSPDVFFHPLWSYFYPHSAFVSSEIIERLQPPIQKLLVDGDYRNAAQLMLICAALEKRYGDPLSSIDTVQNVWKIGDSIKAPEIIRWAAWGGCAIWAGLGELYQAGEHLERLQGQLDVDKDWILASTVEIAKNVLLDSRSDRGSLPEILSWLRSWGEPSYEKSLQASSYGHSSQALARFSINWWRALIKLMVEVLAGEQPLWGELNGRVDKKNGMVDPKTNLHVATPAPQQVARQLPASTFTGAYVGQANQETGQGTDTEPESQVGRERISLKFYCLGSFRLYQNDDWVYRWASRKALSVLKYLVVYHPTPLSKDVLMDSLWPEADTESARRNLHQAIYTLRHTLKEGAPDFQHVLFEKEHYFLNPDMEIWLDFIEFERHYQAGIQMEEVQQFYEAIRSYEAAELLYKGDFMGDDLYEDLPAARRQYFWEMYLSTAYRLTRCYLELGQIRAAIPINQRILERDKTQETAHQNLIQCYIQQGQRNLAIQQYRNCVQILKDELDVPPSAETRAIHQKIIQM